MVYDDTQREEFLLHSDVEPFLNIKFMLLIQLKNTQDIHGIKGMQVHVHPEVAITNGT